MSKDISSSDDMIDLRDVIERFEELETEIEDAREELGDTTDLAAWILEAAATPMDHSYETAVEFLKLQSLLEDLKVYGGDEQWRGDWYPITLIRDTYFVEAMQELVSDIGDLPKDIPAYLEIDWQRTAKNLQVDYSSVEFDGVTYWYR